MKKKVIIVFLILVITFSIVKLYQTFAIDTSVSNASEDIYEVTLNNSTYNVNVPANSSKTVIYKLTNTNQGTVKYGVAYSGTNITVRIYSDSIDPETGNINYLDNKFIKLYVSNSGSTDSTATITTIMGFENGGDLIVPSDVTLVTLKYNTIPAATYINDLYTPNTTAVNNSITYNLDSTNNLMEDTAGNIRYYGASPSNYIYFNCETYPETNCELWRIIGVFGDKIKIIRNNSIGSYSWDNKLSGTGTSTSDNGSNDWTDARLMMLLNPGYEETSDIYSYEGSLYWNSKSGTCYKGSSNGTKSCDFTSTGLKNDVTRNMIAEVTWNLGGWDSRSIYPNKFYEYERGTTVYEGRPTTWTGKVALMYPSDYGYAADLTQCNQTLSSYKDATCTSNNWLYKNAFQWTLAPTSSNANLAWYVDTLGSLTREMFANNALGVQPVLYLDSSAIMGFGSGTQADPYRIST